MGGLLLDWMDEEMCNVMILFIWHVKFVFSTAENIPEVQFY